MTLEEIKEMIRVQLPPMGGAAHVASLRIAPGVWAELAATVPRHAHPQRNRPPRPAKCCVHNQND